MKITRPVSGKILSHDRGMGTPSSDTVWQRAAELARIDGRPAPNEQDWKHAFMELHGGHHEPHAPGDESELLGVITETDSVAPSLGRHVHQADVDGSENLGEELVTEGVEEAEHDSMLESRLRENQEEKEED